MYVRQPKALLALLELAIISLLSSKLAKGQTFPRCGDSVQVLQLDTSQLAFGTNISLTWRCAKFQGYGRECSGNNSVYTFVSLESDAPPYQENLTVRPYVWARAFPNQYGLQAANYYLDMLTGTIFVSPAGPYRGGLMAGGPAGLIYDRYNLTLDSYGYPDANGNVLDKTNPSSQYAFYLNDVRSAIQNVTYPPYGEPAFACNGQLWK